MSILPSYKIVTMGNSSVGKTSLIQRYRFKKFDDLPPVTIGAAFFATVIDNKKVQIWDTAGNERYKSLAPMYIRGSHIVLYCIDSSQLFDEGYHKNSIDFILENSDYQLDIHVVATKKDCSIDSEIRKMKDFCERNGFNFTVTSSKTGEGVDNLFEKVISRLNGIELKNNYSIILESQPTGCFKFLKWF